MFLREYIGKYASLCCGFLLVFMLASIGFSLLWNGTRLFMDFDHSLSEFLFSSSWNPSDTGTGGGDVGAAMFIAGSLMVCFWALLFTAPFAMASALYMTVLEPQKGQAYFLPAIGILAGIPSVVYGWVGLTVLSPVVRDIFDLPNGQTLLTAAIVLSVMIFPTVTSVTADALRHVERKYIEGSYGLGATRWQMMYTVLVPAASSGIVTGFILGLARALGEALAVAMVIGKMKIFPTSLLAPAVNLTTAIASDMGGAMAGGEFYAALWSMALLLFLLSFSFIVIIHSLSGKGRAS